MASTVATWVPSWTSWPTLTSIETSLPASGLVTSPAPEALGGGVAAATGTTTGTTTGAEATEVGAGGAESGAPETSSINSTITSYVLPSTVTFSLFMIKGAARGCCLRQRIL